MDELEEIEARLRHDLRHVAPPAGFAERVAARIGERQQAQHAVANRRPNRTGLLTMANNRGAWWVAAAAAVALAVGGGNIRYQRHQREAASAQAQVDLAMQLTSHALDEVGIGLDRSPAGRFTQVLKAMQK